MKKLRKPTGKKAARLSDATIEEIRSMYETGLFGYATLAKIFGCSKQAIKWYVTYERRLGVRDKW